MAENAWHETTYGVHKNRRGDRAVSQNVIANGNLEIREMFNDTVIDAFVVTANNYQVWACCKLSRERLRKALSLRRHEYDRALSSMQRVHGSKDRLWF